MEHSARGIVLRYGLLPGIFPRLLKLLGPGRGILAASIAYVFNAVRILPDGHPYLNPQNHGKFGVRHVVAEAANSIAWNWRHTDRILVFFMVLTGIAIFTLQFVVLGASLLSMPALALTNYAGIYIPTSPFEIFVTKNPEQDLVFIILDLVFGIPDMFGSCITAGTDCQDNQGAPLPYTAVGNYPTPFQTALHETLAMYSYGLFLVGVLLIIYFTITTVAETAVSGTPFGSRFNRLWAPIRMIFFFFLIVPIVHNLNIAQMATLHAARIGSSLATNIWLTFNTGLDAGNTTVIGENENWIGRPNVPELGSFLQFMQTVTACKYAERILHNRYIQAYLVTNANRDEHDAWYLDISPPGDVVTSPEPAGAVVPGATETFLNDALLFADSGDIVIRFGEYNPDLFGEEKGHVYPWCGELVLINPGVAYDSDIAAGQKIGGIPDDANVATYIAFFAYYEWLVKGSWKYTDLQEYGSNLARNILLNENNPMPTTEDLVELTGNYKKTFDNLVDIGLEGQIQNVDYAISKTLRNKGWGGAAIWYNRIAELNGSFMAAVKGVPQITRWPDAIEQIKEQRLANDNDSSGKDMFNPVLGGGQMVKFRRPEDAQAALVEHSAYMLWQNESTAIQSLGDGGDKREQVVTSNVIIDTINLVFGTSGLFNMRNNSHVHPLAQLTLIGKGLIDSAVNAFGAAAGVALGGMAGLLKNAPGDIGGTMSGLAMTVAGTGLMTGFVLYYVLPFMPFVYFFFAVAGWVKAIFEAMVGVPLWALAHIRIDGEGLPGPSGMNGYFLIFEILVRPALIVFGLIAGITIMDALVRVLNDIFDLAIVNLSGHEAAESVEPDALEFLRSAVDQFFYTILYAITVYMIALSCFKLIDLVPDQIMRWLGTSISQFGDAEKDSAGRLLHTATSGGLMLSSQLKSGALSKGALIGHFFSGR